MILIEIKISIQRKRKEKTLYFPFFYSHKMIKSYSWIILFILGKKFIISIYDAQFFNFTV